MSSLNDLAVSWLLKFRVPRFVSLMWPFVEVVLVRKLASHSLDVGSTSLFIINKCSICSTRSIVVKLEYTRKNSSR